jgi:hypothetical protein
VQAEQEAPRADSAEHKPTTTVSTFGPLTPAAAARVKTVGLILIGAVVASELTFDANDFRSRQESGYCRIRWVGTMESGCGAAASSSLSACVAIPCSCAFQATEGLTLSLQHRSSGRVPWGIDDFVKQEQARRAGTSVAVDEENAQESFTHRMTDMAYGGGLGTIARVDWAPQVGNVHTGAVPPWMVASEDDYRQQNTVQSRSIDTAEYRGRGREEKERDNDWLPNFGGVWESGPRSKTKLAFQQTARRQRKRVTPQPFDRQSGSPNEAQGYDPAVLPSYRSPYEASDERAKESAASTLPVEATASLGEVGEPAKQDQMPPVTLTEPTSSVPSTAAPPLSPLSFPVPPLPEPPSAALVRLMITTWERLRLCCSPRSLFLLLVVQDTKKQQLLAQKERLRAKFAARRQR